MARNLVLGLGGTVDYEIRWQTSVLAALAREHRVCRAELSTTEPIRDERSLLVTILGFLVDGAGGERFVEAADVLEQFAARFDKRVTIGGTGPRAGIVLQRFGIASVQHLVSTNDAIRALLPRSARVISSAWGDSLEPHLIVQYPVGAAIELADGDIVSTASNRLIFANDAPNRELALAAELPEALADAAIFLISGFNTMQDPELLDRRLDQLIAAMERLPADALVYYEDAAFYRTSFAERVRSRLLNRIDVYGMNEDELQGYLGDAVNLRDPDAVLPALREVHRLIPAAVLVVHTRCWAIALGDRAGEHRAALENAVRVAATRYRLGDDWTTADLAATDQLPRDPAGAAVIATIAGRPGYAGVPAFAAESPSPTTIGLGDSFVGGFLAAHAPERTDSR